MSTRIWRVDSTRPAINKPNDRANIIAIWGLPDGQLQQGISRDYFPPVLASASLQPSLRSVACDFMHWARLPLPGLTSAQSFFSSALQALPTAAARMIAT